MILALLEGVHIDANTYITSGAALSIIASALVVVRVSTRMQMRLDELTRTAVRKSAMDLWIARTERVLGVTLPPFPRQEEVGKDDS